MFKKLFAALLCVMMYIIAAPAALAQDYAEFSLSKQKTYLGDEITATLTFSSDQNNIADIQGNINYNDKVLEYIECDDVTYAGGGNLTVRAFTSTGAEGRYTMTFRFKTIGEGDGFIKLVNCRITDSGQNGVRSPGAETSIEVAGSAAATTKQTVTKPDNMEPPTETVTEAASDSGEESSQEQAETTTTTTAQSSASAPASSGEIPEGKLSAVKISTGYISPEFSYDVLEYEIRVPHDCTWLDLEGVTSREGEYIWYTGDENVYDGVITRTIAVRDSAGLETVYTFNISRMSEAEEQQFDNSTVTTTAPEPSSTTATSTTRRLSLDKKTGSFKKLIAAAGIVIVVILVVIVALVSSRSSKGKRKRIKQTKKK
ncbi:MAG: hypothetical protein IJM75_07480 [Ruminococcus sp.]|nr:hypothetical protein [Ruminococcus sp.]